MTPTLLELVIALIIIVTAWQLGIALAPIVLRWWKELKNDLDHVVDEAQRDADTSTVERTTTKENHHGA